MSSQVQPQQPFQIYPNSVSSQPPSNHPNGSFGTVFLVLAVIVVIFAIVCFLGKLCYRRFSHSCEQKPPSMKSKTTLLPKKVENEGNLDSNQSEHIYHMTLDIGGSLAKVVYFTKINDCIIDGEDGVSTEKALPKSKGSKSCAVLRGRLNFKKFETSKINDCLEFIKSMKLHLGGSQQQVSPGSQITAIKATGGGAYKYADLFKERLGINLDKEDEMDCLVTGANFLLKVVHQEAFTYMDGQKQFIQVDHNDLYPYLLVNIGSGVSMIKVEGDGKFERVSGTSVGGGTFWGLGKLLTKCKSFDELLELSYWGNNRVIDMLVGDIYGGLDYSKIGLSSTAIASSFGKAISDNKELEDYKPEDIARSLLRMISNNIGQISYLNALRYGLKRIFFGGFFIRSHPFTMDTISVAVNFWSKGEAKAMFLRHEGFLGAVGAFMRSDKVAHEAPSSVSCAVDGELHGDENVDSIECCIYAA